MTTVSEDLLKRITARPDVFNGKPIIRDMRISVERLCTKSASCTTSLHSAPKSRRG